MLYTYSQHNLYSCQIVCLSLQPHFLLYKREGKEVLSLFLVFFLLLLLLLLFNHCEGDNAQDPGQWTVFIFSTPITQSFTKTAH